MNRKCGPPHRMVSAIACERSHGMAVQLDFQERGTERLRVARLGKIIDVTQKP